MVGEWQENDLRWYHAPAKGRLIGTLFEKDEMWVCEIPDLRPGPVEFLLESPTGEIGFASREEAGKEPALRLQRAP